MAHDKSLRIHLTVSQKSSFGNSYRTELIFGLGAIVITMGEIGQKLDLVITFDWGVLLT